MVRPVFSLRIDNDFFGGLGQDQGYTSGFQATLMSGNLNDVPDQDCVPLIYRGVKHYLEWLQPDGFEQENVIFRFGQAIYTPADHAATAPLLDDRPYAAVLLLGIGYNARDGEHLRTSHLRLGVVGPSAYGEQMQNGAHKVFGSAPWLGWKNQLHDEPVLQFVHERMRRWAPPARRGWNWDLIGHWGLSLGNFATYLNTGAEWRVGHNLPDDFGSDPLRPAGENTAPVRYAKLDEGWAWHVFLTFDARAVARNITLDGNTWRSSQSIAKRAFVADFGWGFAMTRGPWKFAFAHYNRTREFDGQKPLPVFGSFTISRRL